MEFLTSGRDEALKLVLDGLSALIATAETIRHEEENFHRYAEYMIHVRELLRKLQLQQATIEPVRLLQGMEAEVNKARRVIFNYKSQSPLFHPINRRSVVSKLNQSSKEIHAVLQLLPFTQINTALNINETADAIIHGMESIQLELSSNTSAILSSLDLYMSQNSGNQQQTSHSLFAFTRSKGTASSSICPLPVEIEAQESEGERSHVDSYQQLPPSSFFLCSLTCKILEDPVSVSCDHSFERRAIEEHFYAGKNFCPLCSEELSSTGRLELTSNSTLRNSILEWKNRQEQTIAERNAKKKFMAAATKITLDNMENTNRALGELHALMMDTPSCISAATESPCKIIPNLAVLLKNLKNNSSDNASTVLKCLLLIARFSDENKEVIGRRRVIRCLLKQCMAEPNALDVLLELSRNKAVAEKIGGSPYSISVLISILDNRSSAAAAMARTVLENLSIDISATVLMAEFGYFTPFLDRFNSQETSDGIRAQMAEKLSQIQLTETSARNLENERFITHLTQMLSCNSSSSKMASLNCIEQFITFNELKTRFLCAIPALLCLLTTKSMEEESKQKALEILISLVQTTRPSDPGFETLFSSDGVRDMIDRIRTAAPEDQISPLRLLLAMVRSSNAAAEWIVSDHNAMSYLFSAISVEQNSRVTVNALKLIYCIAGNYHLVIPLPSSPSKESIVHSLATILAKNWMDDEELSAAAACILIHLSPDDERINELLQSSALLESIHAFIIHSSNSHLLLENALGVLLRCVNQSRPTLEFQKEVGKLLRADLIQILSTGSPLAKRRAALILSHLSLRITDSSSASSSSRSPHLALHHLVRTRRPAKESGGCPVHKPNCSPQRFVCLVMDEAVKSLIEMVRTMELGSTEAALMALDTLFDPGCDSDGAAAAIVESNGVAPILEALERGEPSVKEMALELLCKIFAHPGVTEKELDRFKGLVLNMVRSEGILKIKSENLIKHLLV